MRWREGEKVPEVEMHAVQDGPREVSRSQAQACGVPPTEGVRICLKAKWEITKLSSKQGSNTVSFVF